MVFLSFFSVPLCHRNGLFSALFRMKGKHFAVSLSIVSFFSYSLEIANVAFTRIVAHDGVIVFGSI